MFPRSSTSIRTAWGDFPNPGISSIISRNHHHKPRPCRQVRVGDGKGPARRRTQELGVVRERRLRLGNANRQVSKTPLRQPRQLLTRLRLHIHTARPGALHPDPRQWLCTASTCSAVSPPNRFTATTTGTRNFCRFSMCRARLAKPPSSFPPPCSTSARTEAISTAAAGFNPDCGITRSKYFSAPRSAPKPVSLTALGCILPVIQILQGTHGGGGMLPVHVPAGGRPVPPLGCGADAASAFCLLTSTYVTGLLPSFVLNSTAIACFASSTN